MPEEPLKYEVVIYWRRDDEVFIAEVPELAGCAADGARPQEAPANAQMVAREWIETAHELGRPVPEPRGRPSSCAETTSTAPLHCLS